MARIGSPEFAQQQSSNLAAIHERAIIQLQLDSTQVADGLRGVREEVEGPGRKRASGGGGGGALSGFASSAGGALMGEAGIGSALSYVANYGLTTLSQIPGAQYFTNAPQLRSLGATFAATVQAGENFTGVTDRFAGVGAPLHKDVKRELARRSLKQQENIANDRLQSKEIFAETARGENGVKIDWDREPEGQMTMKELTAALKILKDAIVNSADKMMQGNSKR